MDGAAAAAAVREDGTEKKHHKGDSASENSVCASAEDTAERVGVFSCGDCGEAFREEAAYLEHQHLHLQEKKYLDKPFDGFHDAEKDRDTAHFCTLCSISFVELNELHLHMEKEHGGSSQRDSSVELNTGKTNQHTYECSDCGKCYGVLGHFLNHQRSHTLASKSVFHDLEHLKKKSFQCESCGRSYSRASALDAHRRCHEEKLVKARNRSSGDSLPVDESTVEAKPTIDQTNNTPEKPFKCSCGKAFPALVRLKTHQRFSRNMLCSPEEMREKPKKICSEFHCSECNKAFHSHIALFNHQRWHSNISNDPAKRFPCELCGKVFMTLTFYNRHQRMAHSDETPAKSFLHQVCQLQKKAFECKDCGLKFSRASALHSHQIHHTENFRETEKGGNISLPPQQNSPESERKDTEQEQKESENVIPTSVSEEDLDVVEMDEDAESYEPGDFNVQVISASESEDEPAQDLNPDLELLCESDHEQRDDCDTGNLHSRIFSKPEMDLKIVQIDFEPSDMQSAPIESEPANYTTGERFDCPDCYRWFTSASSLRVHRMWHSIRKRRQQPQVKPSSLACIDCGLKFADRKVFKNHLHQHALEEEGEEEEEKVGKGENRIHEAQLDFERVVDGENTDKDKGCDENSSYISTSLQTNPSDSTPGVAVAAVSKKKKRRNVNSCSVCGKVYKYLSSFKKHQQIHNKKVTVNTSVPNLTKYECPECGMAFLRKVRLQGHMRIHRSSILLKSEYLKCDQCNKNFKSEKSWMAHLELHELKPFWCLSCTKGFFNEEALEKHLQNHSLKKYACNICNKSFRLHTELKHHYNTHSGAKPFQCTICGKAFSHPGNLVSHRKKHVRVYAGSSGMPVGIKKSAIVAKKLGVKKQRLRLNSVDEKMDTNTDELPGKEDYTEESSVKKPYVSKSPGSDGHDEMGSETSELQTGQQLEEIETENTIMYREHEEWEWECCVCDMGFDEVGKLHMHYIKHATGEVPIPHEDF
ncbi:zinc finger protein 780B isoform X2 [Labrus mixtus]|uniref:zinc finger protein 780B isoform X2 n=1 Tax=Labrus mixtus TaxID=508554 RepID=UPI0029C0641A|nr:zinc finger protein 780B isoform X2 [Labrus mixtus]